MKEIIRGILLDFTETMDDGSNCIEIHKYNNLVDKLDKAFSLNGVVASLPNKEEIELEADKQANYIQPITNEPIYDIDKYEGFINGVNWYAEKMKK
jgi:hypothetical protein